MRGGIFSKMKASKKVDFLERVDKSYLGLEGLQIVVDCDKGGRTNNDLNFVNIEHVVCISPFYFQILRSESACPISTYDSEYSR